MTRSLWLAAILTSAAVTAAWAAPTDHSPLSIPALAVTSSKLPSPRLW